MGIWQFQWENWDQLSIHCNRKDLERISMDITANLATSRYYVWLHSAAGSMDPDVCPGIFRHESDAAKYCNPAHLWVITGHPREIPEAWSFSSSSSFFPSVTFVLHQLQTSITFLRPFLEKLQALMDLQILSYPVTDFLKCPKNRVFEK